MKNALSEIYLGLKSLFIGMRITIGEFFKPTVTVRYPHQTLEIPPRFRGHIELVRDSATGQPKCFVCKLCEKACPSDCITVEGVKPEGARRKTVTSYRLDFTKCSLCGSCVEACRDGAIRFSRDYNLAGLSREEFIMDLFQKLESESPKPKTITAPPVNTTAVSPTAPVAAPQPPRVEPTKQTPVVAGGSVEASPIPAAQKVEVK